MTHRLAVAMLVALALSSARASVATPAEDAAPLRVAMIGAVSGPAKALGRELRLGLEAGLKGRAVSGSSGRTRPIELVVADDGYDPATTREQFAKLVADESILAFVGNVGTPTTLAILPQLEETGILLFAPFTGAQGLRADPPSRHVVHYRASYAEEMDVLIGGLLEQGIGPREIALFTQDDAFGDAGHAAALKVLAERGHPDGERLVHARYPRNTIDVREAALTIRWAEVPPKAVIMVGATAPCARLVSTLGRVLPRVHFASLSFTGSNALLDALGDDAEGLIVTQVVPVLDARHPTVAEYLSDLRAHAPEARPGMVSFEGYLVARLLGRALDRPGVRFTRAGLLDAAADIDVGSLGLGEPGPVRVWPTIVRDGRFQPLRWNDLRETTRAD
ncbi:MAG: ABC transporter substrate-binding protein [Acidobacteriota bacterium]